MPKNLALPPRGVVPKNFINVQTGWADKENPAWDSLPADRRADLARRMAAYAATVDRMDQSIGRVITHLKATKQFDNTLILYLSDNGACAEWDPYGFDKLDSPNNILHTDAELQKIGGPDSYVSYGSGWANASNTPWRLYKHYAQEGGIRTQLIVHWPKGLKSKAGTLSDQPGWIGDIRNTYSAASAQSFQGHFSLEVQLEKDGAMILRVNRKIVARAQAPGLFMVQPADPLSVGEDALSAVGDYAAPNSFQGKTENVKINAH